MRYSDRTILIPVSVLPDLENEDLVWATIGTTTGVLQVLINENAITSNKEVAAELVAATKDYVEVILPVKAVDNSKFVKVPWTYLDLWKKQEKQTKSSQK